MTLPFPDTYAQATPDKPAYVMAGSGVAVTYRELVDASRRIARLLWSRGLRHGDCVAILIENHLALPKVAWAAQRSGLRYVAVSTKLLPDEVRYILADSGARMLFTSARMADVVRQASVGLDSVESVFVVDDVDDPDFESLSSALASTPAGVEPDEREGVDLLYSSGTTGRPKGVAASLTLPPLGTAPGVSDLLHQRWGLDNDSIYLSPAPMYHAAPLRFIMTVHRHGGTAVIMERFDAVAALELIERYRVTHTQMVPTMFIRMLKLPDAQRQAFEVSSLTTVIHSAAPCPADTKRAMIEWLGPIIDEFYSSTENYLFTTLDSHEWLDRPGSVGRAQLGTPHVLDETGQPLPPGEIGTLWSEGGMDFAYLNDPEKTASTRNAQGWSTVGDLGYVDEDGYVYLSDRRADLILSGGVNVYPRESEDILAMHPKVADVAVFGIPDPELGQVVHAVVAPAPGEVGDDALAAELLDYLRDRLAKFKCPRRIDFEDELPRHATGKLYKRLLRDRYSEGSSVPTS
ncbi:AMP-binding protein [Gordonia hydrophobica]|uniref:AMP-binding protein n=1 Tax=Gordonia hydrophobica TaxID=40516 RepID=A0ABZ2U2I8_9ACTN|nr:AMP-binding protein [Gordonia hydrophobica]MBM7366890.1 fatty-acyl-CoA synthase [Gordonia hydrophobica]